MGRRAAPRTAGRPWRGRDTCGSEGQPPATVALVRWPPEGPAARILLPPVPLVAHTRGSLAVVTRGRYTRPLHAAVTRGRYTRPLHTTVTHDRYTRSLHVIVTRGRYMRSSHAGVARRRSRVSLHAGATHSRHTRSLHTVKEEAGVAAEASRRGVRWRDMAGYGGHSEQTAKYGEIRRDMARCGEIWRDMQPS